jgi:hypothetical protein
VLRAWDVETGQVFEPRELLRGRRLVVLPTRDGRHLALRDTLPSPDELTGPQAVRRNDWRFFHPDKGKMIGSGRFVPGTQEVVVKGERAYYLVAGPLRGPLDGLGVRSQMVQAVELYSGRLVWQRPVAGKAFTPPGR